MTSLISHQICTLAMSGNHVVAYALAHVSAVISCMGIASEYLVKWSIKVRRYLFFLGVSGYAHKCPWK